MSKKDQELSPSASKAFVFINYKNIMTNLRARLAVLEAEYRMLSGDQELPHDFKELKSHDTFIKDTHSGRYSISWEEIVKKHPATQIINELKSKIQMLEALISHIKQNQEFPGSEPTYASVMIAIQHGYTNIVRLTENLDLSKLTIKELQQVEKWLEKLSAGLTLSQELSENLQAFAKKLVGELQKKDICQPRFFSPDITKNDNSIPAITDQFSQPSAIQTHPATESALPITIQADVSSPQQTITDIKKKQHLISDTTTTLTEESASQTALAENKKKGLTFVYNGKLFLRGFVAFSGYIGPSVQKLISLLIPDPNYILNAPIVGLEIATCSFLPELKFRLLILAEQECFSSIIREDLRICKICIFFFPLGNEQSGWDSISYEINKRHIRDSRLSNVKSLWLIGFTNENPINPVSLKSFEQFRDEEGLRDSTIVCGSSEKSIKELRKFMRKMIFRIRNEEGYDNMLETEDIQNPPIKNGCSLQ